ncbi:MAG: DUF1320 family protein [Gammaproteobacteria bacterium]|nr:DUF1320 family protein [Gammaproteobacteria bacterium]
MAYCTIQQLEDRLTAPVLGQRIVETGTERERVLTSYIARASAHIDSRLAVRYSTPVEASQLLTDICLTICLWQIEADRGAGNDMPKRVQVPYDESMRLLADLAGGRMDLPGAADATGSAAGLVVSSHPSLFSPDSPGMEAF